MIADPFKVNNINKFNRGISQFNATRIENYYFQSFSKQASYQNQFIRNWMHSRVSIMELQKIIDAYVAINNNSSKPFYRLYLARAVCRLIHKKKKWYAMHVWFRSVLREFSLCFQLSVWLGEHFHSLMNRNVDLNSFH